MARLTVVESEVQRLKVELDDVQAKLKNTSIELGKTQARNKTMEKHEQVSLLLNFSDKKRVTQFISSAVLRRLSMIMVSVLDLRKELNWIRFVHEHARNYTVYHSPECKSREEWDRGVGGGVVTTEFYKQILPCTRPGNSSFFRQTVADKILDPIPSALSVPFTNSL